MSNLICITSAQIVDKLKEAGIVVLIGIVMVFVILALLIAIVNILKYFEAYMVKFDAHMVQVRECNSKIKKIKVANSEHFAHEKNEIRDKQKAGSLTAEQANAALDKLKAEKIVAKQEFIKQKKQLNIRYDTVFNVINEANYRIKKLVKAEKEEYKQAISAVNSDKRKEEIAALKTARMLKKVELDTQIKQEKIECDARVALAKDGKAVPANESHGAKELSDNQLSGVTDGEVIAAITAAITMMLSEETAAKKTSFKVRSIKLVK